MEQPRRAYQQPRTSKQSYDLDYNSIFYVRQVKISQNFQKCELFQINYIRIDKIRELGYNESELMKWLRFIAARNYEERKNIAEGDEMFMEFNEWIDNYVNDDLTRKAMAEWNEKIMTNKQIKIAHEQGIEEGIEEGMKEGAKQEKIEIAKNLLKENVEIDIIISATGLSKEEIEKLKKEE